MATAAVRGPGQQLRDRSGGGQHDRGDDPEGALDHDIPGRPKPGGTATGRERRLRGARPTTGSNNRERQERDLDAQAAGDDPERHRRDGDRCGQDERRPRRPTRLRGAGDDSEDEQHGRGDLDLGREAMKQAVPGVQETLGAAWPAPMSAGPDRGA